MKRVITLLMAAVMVIGTAGLASAAVEFKVSGHMHIALGFQDNGNGTIGHANFNKEIAEDNFYAAQRFRPKLTMKGKGVTAVFEAQQHQAYWGQHLTPSTGASDARIRVRNAYIDFKIPQSPVSLKIGYQQLNLPSVMGHPVFESRVGGVLATVPFSDQVALAAFYARPNAEYNARGKGKEENAIDMFGALLPLNFGNVQATPYLVYAAVGSDMVAPTPPAAKPAGWKNTNDDLIIAGVNLAINPIDALSVKLDAIMTRYSSDNEGLDLGTGWMFVAAVDYQMPWGTPGIFGWYSSGADEDGEGSLWTNPSMSYTDGFCPTSLGAEGYNTFDEGAWVTSSGANTMGIGLQIADMSFIDNLKHTARIAYIKGTADNDAQEYKALDQSTWVDEKWSFVELNFDSTWSIYENLAAVIELGALFPDLNDDYENGGGGKPDGQDDPAYRAQITFRFSF